MIVVLKKRWKNILSSEITKTRNVGDESQDWKLFPNKLGFHFIKYGRRPSVLCK